MFCTNCGKEFAGNEKFCDVCGAPVGILTRPVQTAPVQAAPAQPARVRKDFISAPTWAKAVSVVGFAMALLTLAFVWVEELAPYTYGFAAIGLILCMIAMATKHRNVFSLAGMIMNICIVFIGSIQIASLVNGSIW